MIFEVSKGLAAKKRNSIIFIKSLQSLGLYAKKPNSIIFIKSLQSLQSLLFN